jgi:hypothetical protein
MSSYQVPKEVGKVGTESRTFIEPIANRKDGIQAMFSRQKQAQSSPTKNTSQKRKRSSSPSTSRTIEHRDSIETEVSASKKLGGNGKQQNEDQEVICIDHSPSPTPKTKVCLWSFEPNATLLLLTMTQDIPQQIMFTCSILENPVQSQGDSIR